MSECMVPNRKLTYQITEQVEGDDGLNTPSLLHPQHHLPGSDYEVAELTWENGQLPMLGLGGIASTAPQKATPTWGRTGDTLESIVHQGTCHKQSLNFVQNGQKLKNTSTIVASANRKLGETSGHVQTDPSFAKKRTLSESDRCGRNFSTSVQGSIDRSACASASEAYCIEDIDTTMMTCASFESTRSLKTKTTCGDSVFRNGSENQDEECKTKGETVRSHSTRRSRAAATHNQSERKRRDRINQKMKALQRLVPNANKTDKASMLDEVIEYLKQLQTQVQMMSVRSMPQMMMPMGMQQQLQMSLLARMGMGFGLGMGMGIVDMNMARASPQSLSPLIHPTPVSPNTPTFVTPPFAGHPMVPRQIPSQAAATSSSAPFNDPYCAFLSQAMNIELYNKMAAVYQQQVNQATQATSNPSQSNHVNGK